MGASIENFGNRLEAFLPCSVPNLHFEDALIDFKEDCAELHADGHLVVFLELISCHPVH